MSRIDGVFGDVVLILCGVWIGIGLHVTWIEGQKLIAMIFGAAS